MSLFVAGQNNHSQLIVKHNSENENKIKCVCPPKKVEELNWKNLRSFSIGQFHTVFVDSGGFAFCAGDDTKYQIGTKSRQVYNEVTKIEIEGYENAKFKLADCGKNYTLYLTDEDNIKVLICCNRCKDFKPIQIVFDDEKINIKILKTGKTKIGILDYKDNLNVVDKKHIDLDED